MIMSGRKKKCISDYTEYNKLLTEKKMISKRGDFN